MSGVIKIGGAEGVDRSEGKVPGKRMGGAKGLVGLAGTGRPQAA